MTAGVIDYVLPLPAGTLWEETPVIKEPKVRSVLLTLGHKRGKPREACQKEVPHLSNCSLRQKSEKSTPPSHRWHQIREQCH